jgi:hypothetical protein
MASVLVFAGVSFVNAKTLVFPHALEVSGRISNTQNTFDTQFFMTYSGGLANSPAGTGAVVSLYFFDQRDGQPLKGSNGNIICAPCDYQLGTGGETDAAPRKRTVVMDAEITTRGGGFPRAVVLGFAIAVINGDVGNVNITSAVSNAKTSALDLAVFVFDPQPLEAAAN